MKKTVSIILALILVMASTITFNANTEGASAPSVMMEEALYVHAVSGASDTEAWSMWQSIHDEYYADEDFFTKYFFLPVSSDSEKVEIYNGYDCDITLNGTALASHSSTEFAYTAGTTYKAVVDSQTYKFKFMISTAEAAIYVNNMDADGKGTPLFEYLSEEKEFSAKATGAIVTPDGSIDNTPIKKIKGRGNTTWYKNKKPFNITYSSAVKIAGMNKGKKYSLLANYQDDSLSRNRFLYDLSDAVGMPYASDSRYVDLYINGYYWGSYQLTEKIDVGSSDLISDFEEDDYLDSEGNLKEDFPFLCEVDPGADATDYYTTLSNGMKITIKSPELASGDKYYNEVKNYVKAKYTAFYNAAANKNADLSDYADVESVAKIFLINELGKNWDSGVSSLYFTYKPDSEGNYKFYGSPVWDYDNSLGNATGVWNDLQRYEVYNYELPTGWWNNVMHVESDGSSKNIMSRFSMNKDVLEEAKKIWFDKFVPAVDHFANKKYDEETDKEFYTSDEYYSLVKGTAEMNYKSGWLLNTGGWIADHSNMTNAYYDTEQNTYFLDDYKHYYKSDFDGMYNYARDWLITRAAWMSKEFGENVQTVKVSDPNPKTTVKIKAAKSSIYVGGKTTVKATVTNPKDSTTYSSANKKIATVSSKGVVKGLKAGKVKITAKNNGKTASVTINVKKKANTLKVKAKKITASSTKNKSFAKTKYLSIKNAKGKLVFAGKSGSKSITVNKKTGKLTVKKGLKKGTYKFKVKVTAKGNTTYKSGSKTVTVKIKVK